MRHIIEKLDMKPHIKQVYLKIADTFLEHMPDSLYLDYYQLQELTDIPAHLWEIFLDMPDVQTFIVQKMAKLAEIHARQALQKLSNFKDLSSSDVTALRAMLENSKLISGKANNKPKVVAHFIPPNTIV